MNCRGDGKDGAVKVFGFADDFDAVKVESDNSSKILFQIDGLDDKLKSCGNYSHIRVELKLETQTLKPFFESVFKPN